MSIINDVNYFSCTRQTDESVSCSDLKSDDVNYDECYILSEVYKPVDCDAVVQEFVDKSQLDSSLKLELLNVLKPFGDLLSNKPGCTDLGKHSIKLMEELNLFKKLIE